VELFTQQELSLQLALSMVPAFQEVTACSLAREKVVVSLVTLLFARD